MNQVKFIAIVISLCSGSASYTQNQPLNMPDSFIFNSMEHQRSAGHLSNIYSVMAKYYEGVERANIALLDEVFHKEWFMRDTDTPNQAFLNVESKTVFKERVSNHGPYPGYAVDRSIANFSMAYDRLVFIRVNKDPSRNSTGFFLFNIDGAWKILDKVFVNTKAEPDQTGASQSSYSMVEDLIHAYFESLRLGDANGLRSLLHEKWDLKYLDSDEVLQTVTKSQFIGNHDIEMVNNYDQLMSIDIYHNKLAIIRIDFPALSRSSFITVFKINGAWKIACERRS